MPHDPALDTALEILDGTVCECGHVKGDHAPPDSAPGPCGECVCERFEPVNFFVTRADERD